MTKDEKRFVRLVERFKKAEAFYADPNEPQAKKDAWRPKLEALVDELAAEYCKLLAEGIVGPGDLPEATEDTVMMLFDATDVTGDFDTNRFWEKLSKSSKR